jgi:predicted nicotinamide N-methyase
MAHKISTLDAAAFERDRLPVAPVEGLPGLGLHSATPQSGIGGLVVPGAPAPYWAYVWAGGLALAHHVRCFPQLIKGGS